MANRQHSRSRSSSGGRNPGGRTARAVPVSRISGEIRTSSQPGTPSYTEPEVRRWPHPPEDTLSDSAAPQSALHDIRCALTYQNQLLSDIKAMLEQLTAASTAAEPEGEKQT